MSKKNQKQEGVKSVPVVCKECPVACFDQPTDERHTPNSGACMEAQGEKPTVTFGSVGGVNRLIVRK